MAGRHDLPDMLLEVDYTTDVRPWKLGMYESWGFPEVWVEVPGRWPGGRRRGRSPGLTIHVLEGGRYRESQSSRAFPGWRARAIHNALNEVQLTDWTCMSLKRVGRTLGERDGTSPDDNPWLRSFGKKAGRKAARKVWRRARRKARRRTWRRRCVRCCGCGASRSRRGFRRTRPGSRKRRRRPRSRRGSPATARRTSAPASEGAERQGKAPGSGPPRPQGAVQLWGILCRCDGHPQDPLVGPVEGAVQLWGILCRCDDGWARFSSAPTFELPE